MQTAADALTATYQSAKYSFEWWGHESLERRKKWAELDGEASSLEDMRKPLRAELYNHFRSESVGVSDAEHRAEANEKYKDHLRKLRDARTAANVAMAEVKSFENAFEAWRTEQSTRRAESNIR